MIENRYNLLDEPWIPVTGRSPCGLLEVLRDRRCQELGGNAVQKIALLKLLLAIAQAAATPKDTAEWAAMRPEGLGERCCAYLNAHRDAFWLYGEHPFLQFPAVSRAKLLPLGAFLPEVAMGNTSVLTQIHQGPEMSDALRVLILIQNQSFCLGGKKTDNSVILGKGYEKKPSACPGPGVSFAGLLHSFLIGDSVLETVWLNLLSLSDLARVPQWTEGVGTAPWEAMPQSEDDETARKLKKSLMGRLIPLARFCLLDGDGIRVTEGIVHQGYKDGMQDPSVAVNASKKEIKALWAHAEEHPWRQLSALLSFLDASKPEGVSCLYLRSGLTRLTGSDPEVVGVWSGGMQVSSNAGEQYLTGRDDCVESETRLRIASLWRSERSWFDNLDLSMTTLKKGADNLYGCIKAYFGDLKEEDKGHAAAAQGAFWQMVEPTFQSLVDACGDKRPESIYQDFFVSRYLRFAQSAYDAACPRGTARQLEAWTRHRPGQKLFPDNLKTKDAS